MFKRNTYASIYGWFYTMFVHLLDIVDALVVLLSLGVFSSTISFDLVCKINNIRLKRKIFREKG